MTVFVLLAAASVWWPYWDFKQALFVTRILTHMKPAEESAGMRVWLGPGVETDATALVTGDLAVHAPPKDDDEKSPFAGKEYEGCAVVYQQPEVYSNNLTWGKDWHESGPARLVYGSGAHVGGWYIDYAFYASDLLPRTRIGATEVSCGGGKESCRIVESCVPLGEVSILGNRVMMPREEGQAPARFVALPHPSLVDYPLYQEGLRAPAAFGVNYKVLRAKRVMTSPIKMFMVLSVFSIALLLLSRREIKASAQLLSPESAVPWLLDQTFKTNRTIWGHCVMWAALVVPYLPALAYYYIDQPEAYMFYMRLSAVGLIFLPFAFLQRYRTDPAALPKKEADLVL